MTGIEFLILGGALALLTKKSGYMNTAEEIIKQSEGYHRKMSDGRAQAYPDPAHGWKVPTIGYGTTVYPNGQKVKQGDIITHAEALQYLRHEMKQKETAILKETKVPLTGNQLAALVSFSYNVGTGALFGSTLWRKLQARRPAAEVAAEFDKWIYANGKALPGLVTRRNSERALFLS